MLTHLDRLEAESIYIMREVVSEAERPVMLYSTGKDSSVMVHLARKAFHPGKLPFPLLHIDTTWKFRDMYEFRDRTVKALGLELIVHVNQDGLQANVNPFVHGSTIYTDVMKTAALRQAIDKYRFDAAFGGARRDEERSRAKERIFSLRSPQHHWDPKNQRPELWSLYNGRLRKGQHMRIFPISNWTEMDVWQYIEREQLDLPPLYFAHRRAVFRRNGLLVAVTDVTLPKPGEVVEELTVRFRTVGDMTCTCPVESPATTLAEIILETAATRITERGATRMDDQTSEASMELRKKEGYF
jgi:sulfate adenylyltransferase subunit 2